MFYIPLRGQSLPVLNIICHGTNFQIAALMRQDGTPTAAMVWSTFQRSWRRYFGTPDVMITDGGPEFRGDFAQSGEYAGILQVVVDADAPWQNGKCERHGGLVKDLLAKGLETEVIFAPDDLEDLLAEIVPLRNRRGNRGGFTPYQLVIGQNRRVPHELLSDDAVDEVGMQELNRDDADLDSPAKAFRQSMRIRDHARMLMETHTARERLRSAGKAQLHRDRKFHRGQWVYVWRRDLRGARDRTGRPSLSRWVGPGLVALQDGTTIWVSMRGRLWKCAREQIREATNHESLGAELLTHDHLRQLLTDARSPQTLTEAVDVSAEWTREEDRNQEHHPEAASMENEVIQQTADMLHSDQDNKVQENEVDRSLSESRLELTRMDQSIATESNRPMYPPPGLEDPNRATEHAIVPATTITSHQNIFRRRIPGRRRTLSQTSTAAPLPLEDGSNRSLDLDTVSEDTNETGFSENKRPRTAEFTVTTLPGKEVLKPTESSETTPGVSSTISDAAIESVNRNRMLDFGKTTCRRIHPEPVVEREHSQSSEEHPAALLVGTWYYLTPDSSGALVSEIVDRKDLALERTHTPGHHFTSPRRLWWSEPKSQNAEGHREKATLVVRLQFHAALESGGRQPQRPSRGTQPLSLCPDLSRCTGTSNKETFIEHFVVEARRGCFGIPERVPVLWTVPICWILKPGGKVGRFLGRRPFLRSKREAKPTRDPATAAKTGPPQRKPQDQRHSNSNQRAPTKHPKAFQSLLGSSFQRRGERNSNRRKGGLTKKR